MLMIYSLFHIVNWLRLLDLDLLYARSCRWLHFVAVNFGLAFRTRFTPSPLTKQFTGLFCSAECKSAWTCAKNKFILINKFGTGNKCMGSPLSKMILNHFFGRVQNARLCVIRTPLHFYKRSRLRHTIIKETDSEFQSPFQFYCCWGGNPNLRWLRLSLKVSKKRN